MPEYIMTSSNNALEDHRSMINYYEILKCKINDDISTIKIAYRKLALQYHPDKVQGDENYDFYLRINEAWNTLRNPEQRRIYNAKLYEAKFNIYTQTLNNLKNDDYLSTDGEDT